MKMDVQSPKIEPEKLKPILHGKIEQMDADQLALLNRLLLQLEVEERAHRLSEAFERDRQQDQFRRIPELIQEFRKAHPYR